MEQHSEDAKDDPISTKASTPPIASSQHADGHLPLIHLPNYVIFPIRTLCYPFAIGGSLHARHRFVHTNVLSIVSNNEIAESV